MLPLRTRIIFEVILGVVLAISVVWILRLERRISEYQRRQEADAQAVRLLREALRQKELEKTPAPSTEEIPSAAERAEIAKREAVIARLDQELAEAHAAIADLQNQLSSAKDQSAKDLASAEGNLQKLTADTQAQVADLQKKLDVALAEADAVHQRAAALEADNAKLQKAAASASALSSDTARMFSSLQDLNHRRDVYLTSILRRYRDITGEFRAMSGMMDTGHGGENACSGTTLSRIQNAVSMSEDDMTQLGELNARAQKLERQIFKK